jgi:hypothetical protein
VVQSELHIEDFFITYLNLLKACVLLKDIFVWNGFLHNIQVNLLCKTYDTLSGSSVIVIHGH